MGISTSSLCNIVISKVSFQLGKTFWHDWELERQGDQSYDKSNSQIAVYQAGTPGIVLSHDPMRIVVDGKMFFLTRRQLAEGWEIKKPLVDYS